MFAVVVDSGIHSYMDNHATTHSKHLLCNPVQSMSEFVSSQRVHSFVSVSVTITFFTVVYQEQHVALAL